MADNQAVWARFQLSDLCDLKYGKIVRKTELSDAGYPVWSGYSVVGYHDAFMFEEPQVTITCRGVGGTGDIHMTPPKCWVTNLAISIIPRDTDRVDKNFLYWALKSTDRNELITGSAQYQITIDHLSRHIIPLPPLAEQKVIARILGTLDDKIELNRRMNATLEAMARALFQSWFVNFDPVHAKASGRQPSGMTAPTAALFPASFKDSALGEIPKGWDVCPLSQKIEILSGGTPKTSETTYWNGSIPWYSVKDAPSDSDIWVIQTEKNITQKGVDNSAAKILPANTTIISARGTVGKLALTGSPMAMNQSCYGIRGAKGNGEYFTYFGLRQAVTGLQQRTHGTVFDTITRQTFETLDCVFPPAELTKEFDKFVTPILAQIRANLHQSRILATLRDTLLPKLLSGELSVTKTEINLDAIA